MPNFVLNYPEAYWLHRNAEVLANSTTLTVQSSSHFFKQPKTVDFNNYSSSSIISDSTQHSVTLVCIFPFFPK